MIRSVQTLQRLLACCICLLICATATAADEQVVQFDIHTQPLPSALKRFATQAGMQVLYRQDAVEGATANTVVGRLDRRTALERLLRGTGLEAVYSAEKQVTIRARSGSGHSTAEPSAEASQLTLIQVASIADSPPTGEPGAPRRTKAATEEEDEADADAREVLVRGQRPGFEGVNADLPRTINDVQPYHIFDSKQILQSGVATMEDFLKQRLSMNTSPASLGQGYANTYGNTSSIDLRGIGLDGTLILVNGRRRAGISRSTTIGQPDLNGIPVEAIERIEVLPASASAIYGGNAIGGVVNVVLKSGYSGGTVRMNYENTTASEDAPVRAISGSYGWNLEEGRTRINLMGRYSDGKGVYVRDRPELVRRGIDQALQNHADLLYSGTFPYYGGAVSNIALYTAPYAPPGGTTYINPPGTTSLTLDNGTSLNAVRTAVGYGTAPGQSPAAGLLANAGIYNTDTGPNTGYWGANSLIGWKPSRARSVAANLDRAMTPWLRAFLEFSRDQNISITTFAPFTYTQMAGNAPNNPFRENITISLPVDLNVPDINNTVTTTTTTGFNLKLPAGWNAEMDYTRSRSSFTLNFAYVDTNGVKAALHSGALNPFVDTTRYPLPSMERFLAPGDWYYATGTDTIGLRAVGSLRLGGMVAQLSAGVSYTSENLDEGRAATTYPYDPRDNSVTTYFAQGSDVQSVYAELQLPLFDRRNARPGLRALELQIAGRADRYKVDTGTSFSSARPNLTPPTVTYYPATPTGQPYRAEARFESINPTVGFRYQPRESWTLRAAWSTAFLPPSFSQLVPSVVPSTFPTTISDPQTNTQYGVYTLSGGNPAVKPKTSESLTMGVIYMPPAGSALEGLRVNLEYYSIVQNDVIMAPTAQDVINEPQLASRVTRNPVSGLITVVDITQLNANEFDTSGYDLSVQYARTTPVGAFNFDTTLTRVNEDRRQIVYGKPFVDYLGYVPEGGPGQYKGSATLSWQRNGMLIGWTSTYYDSYHQYASPGSPYVQRGFSFPRYYLAQGSAPIPSQMYHDLFATYVFPRQAGGSLAQWLSGTTLQFGLKNVFDTLPPYDAFRAPFYYSNYGNARLRSYWLSLSRDFGGR